MKFKLEKIYFLIGLILVLGINYNTFVSSSSSTTNKTTTTIVKTESGSLKESIEVSGSAELVNEQSIRFTQTGKITKVNYKAGDKVKAGDVIAEIDNTDGTKSVKEAQINLENARLALASLYEEKDQSQYLQAQNNVDNTQKSIEVAQKELENLYKTKENGLQDILTNIENLKKELENAKNSLSLSQVDLETTKKQQSDTISTTKTNRENTIKQIQTEYKKYITEMDQSLEKIDVILGVSEDNKSKNDTYEIYLGAKNTGVKNEAITSYNTAYKSFLQTQTAIANFSYSTDPSENIAILNQVAQTYKDIGNAADGLYKTLNNSVETDELSTSSIDTMKNSMSSIISTSQSKISSITSSISNLKTLSNIDLQEETNANTLKNKEQSIETSNLTIKKKQDEINTQQENYKTQESNYNLNIQSKLNSIENLKRTLELNKQSQKELYEGPTEENVQKAKNSVKQAEMSLESAQKGLEKYVLEAPFDGVIRKIDYQVGDNLLSDSDKYVYIENPNMLEISISLDQVDIINVNLGDTAYVTFDAYPNNAVKAKVSSIDTTPTSTSGVVSYTVKLVLNDETFTQTILSGMTADIEIITKEINNATVIDSSAITTKDNKSYLTKMENGKETQVEIVTGITQDGKTQIASGASIGETFIIKTTSSDSSSSSSSSGLFNFGGNKKSSSSSSSSSNRQSGGDMGGPPGGF